MRRFKMGFGLQAGIALTALTLLCSVARGDGTVATGRGGSLGVVTQILGEDWRESVAYWASGVMVTQVAPGGAAERAGVAPGDILVSVGSRVLHNPGDLMAAESAIERGRPVPVVVARDAGRVIRIFNLDTGDGLGAGSEVAAADQTTPPPDAEDAATGTVPASQVPGGSAIPAPESAAAAQAAPASLPVPAAARHAATGDLGVRAENLDWDRAEELGATAGRGVFVADVTGGSAAEAAGIRAGDVITWAGGQPVADADGLERIVASASSSLSIVTVRRGTTRPVTVDLATSVPPARGSEPTISPEYVAVTGIDALVIALREEVRFLREEVRRIREELASLRGAAQRP